MDTLLHNKRCLFTTDGHLEIYNYKLANKFNRAFKKYDKGRYIFKQGEECVYNFPPEQIPTVSIMLLMGRR